LIAVALAVALAVAPPTDAQTQNPKGDLSGVVLNPDGTPAGGATVVLVTGKPWHGLPWIVENVEGKPDPRGEGLVVVQTDRQGQFVFRKPVNPVRFIILAESGRTSALATTTNSSFRLEPWQFSAYRNGDSLEDLAGNLMLEDNSPIEEWLGAGVIATEPLIPEEYRRKTFTHNPFDSPIIKARKELIKQGTNAWTVIPQLVDNLLNTNHGKMQGQYASALILGSIRADESPCWPLMKQRLANRSEPVDAFGFFLQHGIDWPDRVNPAAQRFSLLALAAIGPPAGSPDKTALPGMLALVNSNSEELRPLALEALGSLRSGGSNAVPALEKLLNDPMEYPSIRMPAGVALAQIQPADTNALRVFREGLRDERTVMRVYSAEGLRRLGADPDEYYPALTNALGHKLVTVRCAALNTLGQLGKRALDAKPLIATLTTDDNETIRNNAIKA
jgi:hypothetical protein